jgi:hypothetical protein
MRINVEDYLMGRDHDFPGECTEVVLDNAAKTVASVNGLLAALETANIEIEANPQTRTPISSGWRPAQINSRIMGAALRSKHMSGEACDLYDPDGLIDDFLMGEEGQRALVDLRLFLEHPSATKGWCHVQTVAPRSGKRVFYP